MTGERIWESQAVTKERARWASGLIVRNGDRLFINNDRGELIIVKPSAHGYHEISRTHLIAPTSPPGNRRELTNVNWSHPATRTGTSMHATTRRSSAPRWPRTTSDIRERYESGDAAERAHPVGPAARPTACD